MSTRLAYKTYWHAPGYRDLTLAQIVWPTVTPWKAGGET
jgi:hypothetical protein